MYLRRSTTLKYLVGATLVISIVLYSEWFVYSWQPHSWHKDLQFYKDDINQRAHNCTKILFIADPQIQGYEAVRPPLNYLFNWDSDKFLKSTFQVVMNHFKPDVLVFLGDLMDEGSIATRLQFHNYVERLENIFQVDHPIMKIWISGDNDIGGENEPIRKEMVKEFDIAFQQPPVVKFDNILFYKVNGITHEIPEKREGNFFKIVISHYPITSKPLFGEKVNNVLRPNIYFCAHEHESKYVKQNEQLKSRKTFIYKGNQVLDIAFDDKEIYEIYVPTCSYRMGTNLIGYGAAVLDVNNNRMKYTVFWSPQRFPFLLLHLVLIIVLSFICMCFFFKILQKYLLSTNISEKTMEKENIPFLKQI